MYYQPKHLTRADLRAYRRNQRRLKHLKQIPNFLLTVLTVASCLWLGWLLVSFIDVNAHNTLPGAAEHLWLGSWNAFEFLFPVV